MEGRLYDGASLRVSALQTCMSAVTLGLPGLKGNEVTDGELLQ